MTKRQLLQRVKNRFNDHVTISEDTNNRWIQISADCESGFCFMPGEHTRVEGGYYGTIKISDLRDNLWGILKQESIDTCEDPECSWCQLK